MKKYYVYTCDLCHEHIVREDGFIGMCCGELLRNTGVEFKY